MDVVGVDNVSWEGANVTLALMDLIVDRVSYFTRPYSARTRKKCNDSQ